MPVGGVSPLFEQTMMAYVLMFAMDNTTIVSYTNKQGGDTVSLPAPSSSGTIPVVTLPGHSSQGLSRPNQLITMEWHLHTEVTKFFELCGLPTVPQWICFPQSTTAAPPVQCLQYRSHKHCW